ncbi:MAG: DUF86 domain-containing protein [Chloroflexi bacterium]|nr:DUF86 domain-containing protein [Chloroflexota bacterium]
MIKPEVVIGLLRSLRTQIDPLRPLEGSDLKELTADPLRWNGILHLLQVSIEHVTDISTHLLVGKNIDAPDSHRLIIRKLGEAGFLPDELAERLAPMASFRNIVVHDYLTIDPAIVADILQNHLNDFDEFALHIYDYLRREGHLPSSDEKHE